MGHSSSIDLGPGRNHSAGLREATLLLPSILLLTYLLNKHLLSTYCVLGPGIPGMQQ